MVLVVISNTSWRWTRKSEDAKDLKDEKENMKEVFAHWQENISNKIYTTTTSTSTMPPTTSTSTMSPTTTTNNHKEVIKAIEELKDEIRKERKVEMEKNKQDRIKTLIYLCRVHGFFSRRDDGTGHHELKYQIEKCTKLLHEIFSKPISPELSDLWITKMPDHVQMAENLGERKWIGKFNS